jgi:uncharacterized protein
MMNSTIATPEGLVNRPALVISEPADASPAVIPSARRAARLSSVDVLRGFALLGILVMNINAFADVEVLHDIPFGTAQDAFSGPHASLNLALFYIKWMFFEGKMRAIFSMLFGAGVVLLTSRAEKRGADGTIADIYLRRNMVLLVLGMIHGIFIWHGDILFDYALPALLVLYPLRKAAPKKLLLAGVLIAAVSTGVYSTYYHTPSSIALSHRAAAVATEVQQHKPISAEDRAVQTAWDARLKSNQPGTPAQIQEEVAKARQQTYVDGVIARLPFYLGTGLWFHVWLMPDVLSVMLIGMALFRLGFLTGEVSMATYVWTAVIGFGISLPLSVLGVARTYANDHYFFLNALEWLYFPYDVTRLSGMVAMVAAVMIVIKLGLFKRAQRLLAAVGQTALSNYLMTSLLCQFIFLWGPWKLFGTLQYYQQMYVVFGVWAVNLTLSSLWLRYFQFGPVEWVWRSLTYGKRQPMLIRGDAVYT